MYLKTTPTMLDDTMENIIQTVYGFDVAQINPLVSPINLPDAKPLGLPEELSCKYLSLLIGNRDYDINVHIFKKDDKDLFYVYWEEDFIIEQPGTTLEENIVRALFGTHDKTLKLDIFGSLNDAIQYTVTELEKNGFQYNPDNNEWTHI